MNEPEAHWGKLSAVRGESPRPDHHDAEAECFANCLTSPEGRRMMEILRRMTVERRVRPNAPESELREVEAQRSLVFHMESERDKGLSLQAQRSKSKA